MTSGDWLPAQAPFDLVRRGYSPEQVTAHLERLEYDLRIATANRDATNQRLSELGSQLATAQAEADVLRAQLDRSALEPVSMSGLSDRMQRMIRLAEEEASDIKARAEADADRLRSQLETALAEAAEARSSFDSERERTRKQLAEQVHGLIAEATAEAEDTRVQAQEESSRLLQEANAEAEHTVTEARRYSDHLVAEAKAQADHTVSEAQQHAETTVSEANQVAATLQADSRAEADRLVTEATNTAAALTAESAAQRDMLDAAALAHRTQVQDDFQIAITARRTEAARTIADREAVTRATAEKLVADATAKSEQLVATATAESELLMQRATTYANALVNRASVESHHRVADADQAVAELHDLRSRILEQLNSLAGHLTHIRELVGSAPGLLAAPEQEAGRPRVEDFPADPAGRPTDVPLPMPVLETGPATPGDAQPADSAPGSESDLSRPADQIAGRATDGDTAESPVGSDGLGDQPDPARVTLAKAEPAEARVEDERTAGTGGPLDAHPDQADVESAGTTSNGQSLRQRTFGPGRNRR